METTKDLTKQKTEWPSLLENSGWLNKYFDTPLDSNFNFSRVLNTPAINVKETEQEYHISIAAPGLEKQDFDVQLNQEILTISAEKRENKETNGKFNRREYNYSSWARSFTLPEDAVDGKIYAEYKNGELRIAIPRSGKKVRQEGKKIQIN
jgi:HSP20 family protein